MARKCEHNHIVTETRGQIYFSAGDVVDTLQTYLVCIDCGAEIEPEHDDLSGFDPAEVPF